MFDITKATPPEPHRGPTNFPSIERAFSAHVNRRGTSQEPATNKRSLRGKCHSSKLFGETPFANACGNIRGVVRILAPCWPRFACGRGNSLLELSVLQHQTSNQASPPDESILVRLSGIFLAAEVGQFGLTVMPLEGNADMIVGVSAHLGIVMDGHAIVHAAVAFLVTPGLEASC